jgi:hypothetical protein
VSHKIVTGSVTRIVTRQKDHDLGESSTRPDEDRVFGRKRGFRGRIFTIEEKRT